MYPLLHSSSFFFFLAIVFSSLELSTPFRIIEDEAKFEACSQRFYCGNVANIEYPFWAGDQIQDCGQPEFGLECHDSTTLRWRLCQENFHVLGIRQMDQTLAVVGKDIMDDGCPDKISDIIVGDSPFECASNNAKLTYALTAVMGLFHVQYLLRRDVREMLNQYITVFFEVGPEHGDPSCNGRINVPILHKHNLDLMHKILTAKEAVKRGFDLRYNDVYAGRDCRECMESAGQYGYNRTSHEFVLILMDTREIICCILAYSSVLGTEFHDSIMFSLYD